MDELLTAAVSALVGSVVTLFWESVVKPGRERSAIAAAIAGELLNNARQPRQHVASQAADEGIDPSDLRLTMSVYTARASRVGELRFARRPHDHSHVSQH